MTAIITPIARQEKNPSADEMKAQITKAQANGARDVIANIKHIHQLIQSGDLEKDEILGLLTKHVNVSSFETPVETYLKSPQGGHIDNVMADLLAGEEIEMTADVQEPTFQFLIRSLAIKVANGEVPLKALPSLEASTTLAI